MLLLNLLQQSPIYFLGFLLALVFAITVHEYAHAWMATRLGDPTAKFEGRLSLNPLAHLDPVGTIFLLLVGFGWGKPVPINPSYFQKKSDELKVAFAGIVTNIIFAFLLAIPGRISLQFGHQILPYPVLAILDIAVSLNILLAAFNLLPVPPLDGSHLIEYFLSGAAKIQYQYFGPFILIGLLLADRLFGQSIIQAIMQPIINALTLIVKG